MPQAQLFLDARASLVESPVWDADSQELVWVDISTGLLHRTSASGGDNRAARLPAPLASVQQRREGGFVAALADRVVLTDDSGRILRDLARVEHAHQATRLNEGKCDPFGNFVVGGMDRTPDDPDAALYRITPDGDVTILRRGLGTTNGIEFSDEGDRIWVTDTKVRTIFTATYGADGVVGEFEEFASGRRHDGLVRDSLGEFWGAVYGAGEIVHLSPTGELLGTVTVPAPNVTGITIGGPDLATLFVGSARDGATGQQLEESPLSGGVFVYEMDRPGLPAHRFAG